MSSTQQTRDEAAASGRFNDPETAGTVEEAVKAADVQAEKRRRDALNRQNAKPLIASRDRLRGVRDEIAATRTGTTAGVELSADELLEFARRGITDPTDAERAATVVVVQEYAEHGNLDRAMEAGFQALES